MDTIQVPELTRDQLALWESWEKFSKQQIRLWKEIQSAVERGDLARAQKTLTQLEKLEQPPGPSPQARETLHHWCAHEEKQRPLRFARQLKEACAQFEVAFQQLGASPPAFRLDPLEIEVDLRKGEAVLTYARQELARVPLDCAQILKERQKLLSSLETSDFSPEDYLSKLHEAYRRALGNHKWGERVDLVEVLPELAFLLQSDRFRGDPTRESFRPYGKVRFAYDLARLRKSRVLEIQGSRLTLGTATLGSTRNKERVLYLEEAGQGQYYLSLAFQR